jgi:uncharacterized membrane protein YdjX (TVP38/TMEM64 family)
MNAEPSVPEFDPSSGLPDDPAKAPSLWENYLRNGLLIAVFLLMVWLAFNVHLPSIEEIRSRVDGTSWSARFGFIILYALVAITPIPISVMAICGGLLFGVFQGTAFSLIGVLLGSWAAYWLARALGRATVRKLMGKHAVRIEQRLESRGLLAVFMLRLMPGIPYWPVNYGSGAFGVSQRDYLVASALSVIPGQLSLVAIGSFIAVPNVFNGMVIGISWIMVGVLTVWAYLRWRRQPVPAAPVAS